MAVNLTEINIFFFYNISTFEKNVTTSPYDNKTEYCFNSEPVFYKILFGIQTIVPQWEALATVFVLTTIIIGTIVGNILVILGVFLHKPIRIVQNFFIVSLAVADLTVAILVMPFNVAYSTLGKWHWGKHLCKIWLTCDILCCTSSILNLCVIALDRYWAITDPINYANKRTLKRVALQIAGVWLLSLLISSPPLLGWNDWPADFTLDTPCQLTSERGYVVYSSLGSFFIPLVIMAVVYYQIWQAAKKRFRRRVLASRVHKRRRAVVLENMDKEDSKGESDNENESDSSQSGIKKCQRKAFMDIKRNLFLPLLLLNDPVSRERMQSDINNATASQENYRNRFMNTIKRVSQRRKPKEKPLLAAIDDKGNVIHQFIEEKQKISLSKERRAARTLGIIMGVFVICWLPFFLMYIVLAFCNSCCPNHYLINFITWLGYINSTLNPLIYTIFNLDFRKAFQKLLCCST